MKKRVLHVIDTSGAGGAETVFKTLAARITSDQFDSIALIKGDGWLKQSLLKSNVRFYEKDCKGSLNVTFLWYLISLIRKEKIDVIHTHLLGSNLYGSLAGAITAVPVICTFHGKVDVNTRERFAKSKLRLVNALARKIVFVSDGLRDYVNGIYRFNNRKAVVVMNGVDTPQRLVGQATAKRKLNLPEHTVILGALGNIRPAKNYANFVEAVRILRDQNLPILALVAGDGGNALQSELEQLIAKYRLEEHFRFLGFAEDTDAFLESLDVYVMSSSSEGLPLSLVQAMMNALPIVATRCGVEEFITHEEEGLLVDNNQSEALAEGIALAISHPEETGQMAERAKQKANRLYGMEAMLTAYRKLYANV